MKLELYKKIIETYEVQRSRNCLKELMAEFPDVPEKTLRSIVSQHYQRKIQRTFWIHQNPANSYQYYMRYLEAAANATNCGILIKLADEVEFSPFLLARLILEHFCKARHPEATESEIKKMVDEQSKDPSLIDDPQLSLEVDLCIQEDKDYGPVAEAIKLSSGLECENNLRNELKRLGISFSQEPSLRSSGFDKTPDIRLEVPIAIGGRIVNWIESKASFGDVERHKEYLVQQYARYKTRFGPGLVIYWTGFIDELKLYKRKNLFIMDHMPSVVKLMDPFRHVKQREMLESSCS